MIPTSETGPDGGHSLYCLSDVDGCLITEDLYWDFSAAMQAAVEQSGTHEVWTEQVLVVGFPPSPVVPPPNLQEVGQVAAIVLRKVVFSPATGQALEPTIHPTPWGELQKQIDAQGEMVNGLKDALVKTLAMTSKALDCLDELEAKHMYEEEWSISNQIVALDGIKATVKELSCIPF